MQRGKLATVNAIRAKEDSDENAVLWNAMQEGIDNQRYCETIQELKLLTLDDVRRRLAVIKGKYGRFDEWDKFDEARWANLAWRANQLGCNNPHWLAIQKEVN